MCPKLTAKQEKFVQGLVAGLSQRQAYRQAYPHTNKWKVGSIDTEAWKLRNQPEVLQRYRQCLEAVSNKALWSRESAFNEYEWLKNQAKEDIQDKGVRQANSNAFLNALDGMNNMAFRDLELADEKLRAEIEKIKTDVDLREGSDQSNKQITAIADLINTPRAERVLQDFMTPIVEDKSEETESEGTE